MNKAKDRAFGRKWADKALVCWVEGSDSGYVGPKQGNASGDAWDTPEAALSRKLAKAVDAVVHDCALPNRVRTMLRACVIARGGQHFVRNYVYRGSDGRPQKASVLMILQLSEFMRRLVVYMIEHPEVTVVKGICDEVA